ncbi:MAG: TadE/TadG family type IV pilus assembly protein [bacterium]
MLNATSHHVRRFRRDEDGALIIFALMLFVLMVMMGGFVVDLMRYETTRTNLWNTLDRSTLAAAALSQRLNREAVVRDYMAKAGISDQLASVTITEGQNSAVVRATGRADTHPLFLHMLGIEKFDALGRSQAEQAITNVEIVLVLDVTGSMQNNNKIGNLKIAASEFVDTVLANDPDHRITISIVPYNAQVNIGPDLVSAFNITGPNGVANVNCVEPAPAAFNTLALSRTDPIPMVAYADIAHNTTQTNGYISPVSSAALPNYSSEFCKPSTVNVIRLPSNNAILLKQQINALFAEGNTSITLGMKWGVTMLDPSMRSAYAGFIAQGKMPGSAVNRPFAYDDKDNMKFIVLMTDGQHVAHDRIVDDYKAGPSPIYKGSDGNYSVRFTTGRPAVAGSNQYFVPHLGNWQATPWNGGTQQTWTQIWANLKTSYVAWQFYARALGTDSNTRNTIYNNTFNAMVQSYGSPSGMDVSLNQTCSLAKDQGVIIYGIAFEAPPVGQAAIRNCSTDPTGGSHYFAASGMQIQTAFRAIASNMTMLKLTQ